MDKREKGITVTTTLLHRHQELQDTWGDETVSMKIIKNEVANGNGKLHTDCVVKLGGSTSKWHKIFTFKNGKVVDEEYHLL